MTYKHNNTMTPQSQTQTLGLHRDSRTITKIQPKIRIIHIYAPEIIKTDVANFRELVQRLTGKPTSAENVGQAKGKGKAKAVKNKIPFNNYNNDKPMVNTKLEVMMGSTTTTTTGSSSSPSSSCDHHTNHNDDNQGFWRNSNIDHHNSNNNNNSNTNTSGGFLSAFTDIDDHFDLSMFTLGVHEGNNSHHLHSFGEAPQLSFRG